MKIVPSCSKGQCLFIYFSIRLFKQSFNPYLAALGTWWHACIHNPRVPSLASQYHCSQFRTRHGMSLWLVIPCRECSIQSAQVTQEPALSAPPRLSWLVWGFSREYLSNTQKIQKGTIREQIWESLAYILQFQKTDLTKFSAKSFMKSSKEKKILNSA